MVSFPVGEGFSPGVTVGVRLYRGGVNSSSFPTVPEVRSAHPGELAVLLSTMTTDAVSAMGAEAAEAVVVATQRVSSWAAGMQAVGVDRVAEHVLDAQDAHAADLMAARDAQRSQVEAAGRVWRAGRGAVALPEPEQVAASMLAPELRISPRTMRTRLNRARRHDGASAHARAGPRG